MRSGILFLLVVNGGLVVGCAPSPSKVPVARVELPKGLRKPADLKPDPKPSAVVRSGQESTSAPQAPKGAPSVAGVCRYGEATVECWNVAGRSDRPLTLSVKALLRAGHTPLPTVFDRRNRIVAVDLPRPSDDVDYQIVGGKRLGDGLATALSTKGRRLFFVDENARAAKTSIEIVESRRLPGTTSLPMKKGATLKRGLYADRAGG